MGFGHRVIKTDFPQRTMAEIIHQTYNKLIRDKIPKIISQSGFDYAVETWLHESYVSAIKEIWTHLTPHISYVHYRNTLSFLVLDKAFQLFYKPQ